MPRPFQKVTSFGSDPRPEPTGRSPSPADRPAAPEPAGRAAGSPLCVLVVDDEPAVAGLLRELLEADGYPVTLASDGPEALACIEAGGIDLVLLDLMLPSLSGLEVCRRVRMAP